MPLGHTPLSTTKADGDAAHTAGHNVTNTAVNAIGAYIDASLATSAEVTSAVAAHEADTTAVHGITDTSALETTTGSAAKVTTHAGATDPHADRAYADSAIATHSADTTSVHGITDTSVLATDSDVSAAVSAHVAAEDPHGDRAYTEAAGVYRRSTDPTTAKMEGRATQLTIPTYEGSGVLIHPSVYYTPSGFGGKRYWLTATPYPGDDNAFENPSIWYSDDGDTWTVPVGVTNPVVPHPGGSSYNSDPHLVRGPDELLYLFWRAALDNGATGERIRYKTSADGVTWSATVETGVTSDPNVRSFISPAVIVSDGQWVMYCVNAFPATRTIVRLTADDPAGPWSSPTVVTLAGTVPSQVWNVDAHLVADEWQMLIQSGGSSGGDLYVASSIDGLTFTLGGPIANRYFNYDTIYYRSCFLPAIRNSGFAWDMWVTGFGTPHAIGRAFVSFNELRTTITQARYINDVLAAVRRMPPWIVGDTFARDDAGSITTADSGHTWTDGTGFAIVDRAASPASAANVRMSLDVDVTDHWASVEFVGPTTVEHWLMLRFVDAGNYYRIGIDGNPSTGVSVQAIAGGDLTELGTVRVPESGLETLGVRMVGTAMTVYVNGDLIRTFTDSSLTAGTAVGVQANNTTAAFRNFTCRASA